MRSAALRAVDKRVVVLERWHRFMLALLHSHRVGTKLASRKATLGYGGVHVPDFSEILLPQAGVLEMMLRGTVVYWAMFILLRISGRRDVGSLGTADLLVLVLVADAAGSAMSGDSTSVIDGIYVVATIFFWTVAADRVSFYVPAIDRLLEPERVCLVRDGRLDRAGMRREYVTRGELMEQLRLQGIGSLRTVRRAYLEASGEISVVTMDKEAPKGSSTLEEK